MNCARGSVALDSNAGTACRPLLEVGGGSEVDRKIRGVEFKAKNCNLVAIRKMEGIDFEVVTGFSNRGVAIRNLAVSCFVSAWRFARFEHTSGSGFAPGASSTGAF